MTKEKKERHPDDDFGGISRSEAAFVLILAVLMHPWRAVKELLNELPAVLRRLGRRALGFAMIPFALLWLRRRDRHPTFEEYLRRPDEERDRP
ncbi:hypothetical protein ACQPZP_00485 [Spirillospora sp. CA-142024]|uniref:hypothetical protein n=1 Tax=Spirillospora sp. CA-142024 TaxID=3240036 RepID=UPI003D928E1E